MADVIEEQVPQDTIDHHVQDDDRDTQEDPSQQQAMVAVASNNNNGTVEHHDWLALIPSILSRRGFTCTEQTSDSASKLFEEGLLGNFTQANSNCWLSPEVEASLLESFIEDDYEGALHLTTLDNDQGRPVGFVFWRQVPEDEMKDWIHWENLQKRLMGEQQQRREQNPTIENNHGDDDDNDTELPTIPTQRSRRRMRRSIHMVREESIRWLDVASSVSRRASMTNLQQSTTAVVETLTHSWVKIELLAVHPEYWKQHIGTLLLACAMYQAYQKGEDHLILHVAGGKENVPALRLYDKFGFLPVPPGTVFRKPDRDLFVLGHVGQSLQRLCWPALEV